jgi:zinc protease
MRVLVEENHDLPLVRVQLALASGAADDRPSDDGLTNFATELMARGAGGKTRAELDRAFDALGTGLDPVTDLDGTYFEVTVLRDKLDAALTLLSDVVTRPDFPSSEADKLRREIAAQLDELRDDDGQLVRRFFARQLYGEHPYGRTIIGTERTLPRLDAARAREWYARTVTSDGLLVGFAGDVAPSEAQALAERAFGALPRGDAGMHRYPDPPTRRGMRITIVDKPERTQSQILWGQPAPQWGTPDFFALQVATCAYGGTFTARLMNEVRSKRGFSYGASARLGQGRGRKALVAHIFPSLEQTPEALRLVLDLHREWVEGGITQEELEFARGYLARSFAFTMATPEDRLELAIGCSVAGLPVDHAARFPERISAVTLEDTRRAMRTWLTPRDLEVCIVSTADALVPRLRDAGLLDGVELVVLPYTDSSRLLVGSDDAQSLHGTQDRVS